MEQRKNTRISRTFSSQVVNLTSEATSDALILDISSGGMKISLPQEDFAQVGEDLLVSFDFLVAYGEDEINLRCLVRSKFPHGKRWSYGLQAQDEPQVMEKLKETWLAILFEELFPDQQHDYFLRT